MQGVFGCFIQRYIHSVIPQRRSPFAVKQKREQFSSDIPDGVYEDEYSCSPPALGMIIISIVEIALYLYDVVEGSNKSSFLDDPAAQLFIYNPHKRYQIWRYITYMFVHAG